MVEVCDHCGQPIADVRHGVKLTPLKARIFDLIKARPGINRKELAYAVYSTVTEAHCYTVGAHVQQINDKMLLSDVKIRAAPYYGYRLYKRKSRDG